MTALPSNMLKERKEDRGLIVAQVLTGSSPVFQPNGFVAQKVERMVEVHRVRSSILTGISIYHRSSAGRAFA